MGVLGYKNAAGRILKLAFAMSRICMHGTHSQQHVKAHVILPCLVNAKLFDYSILLLARETISISFCDLEFCRLLFYLRA